MKRNEAGQGLVEYALILVLVAVVVIAILVVLGPAIGNVFSGIIDGVSGSGGGASQGAAMAYRYGDGVKFGRYEAAEPGSVETMRETYDVLRDDAHEQELALWELVDLMEETLFETLEAPTEFAEDSGDQLLSEQLLAIQEAAENGDYEAVIALFVALGTSAADIPVDIQLRSMAKYAPRVVRACSLLNGTQVSYETFSEAREAMVLLGELERAIKMDQVWDQIIEPRNAIVAGLQPGLYENGESGIAILRDSGQTKYIALAEQLEEDLTACGDG